MRSTKYRVGQPVRHIKTGVMGTVAQLNPNRRKSVSGKVHDIFVTWEGRHGATFGASFTEIEAR